MNIPFKKHSGYNPLGDCGKGKCPICARNNAIFSVKQSLKKEEFTTDAVAPFVGRFGYPNVNVGILAPAQNSKDSWLYDAPSCWAERKFEIPKIVDFRSSLLNSKAPANIRKNTKLIEISRDVAMSSLPVDADIILREKPKFSLNSDSMMAPTGPNASLKKIVLTKNPTIHTKVYKVFSDIDMKATEALNYLYENNFDENFLSKMLSVGTVGIKKNRTLVPTRWSITATDDAIGKKLIEDAKNFSQFGTHLAFFGGYLGNYYLILGFPDVWSYELFETYVPNGHDIKNELEFMTDHETYAGRKEYAKETSGGYYTVRLAILEHLKKMKRQGSFLALRFITDEYTMPLGVWVTRQAARNAVNSRPIEFSSRELMLEYARKLVKKYFSYNADFILKRSKILVGLKHQSKLRAFL